MMCGGGQQCEVCGEAEAKYKCPKCRLKNCSVGCYKNHQQSQQCQPSNAPHNHRREDREEGHVSRYHVLFPTDDTVAPLTLDKLRECEKLKGLLGNRHLREVLREVDSATNAQVAMRSAMLEPIFTEFADTVLGVVEPDMEAAAPPSHRKQESV